MEKRGVILWIRYILLYKSINLTNGMTQSQKKKKEILSKKNHKKVMLEILQIFLCVTDHKKVNQIFIYYVVAPFVSTQNIYKGKII